MTTAVSTRKSVSRQNQLFPPQPGLPFPTSPALPARRTRLEGSNLAQTSGHTNRLGSRIHVMRSKTAYSYNGVGRGSSSMFNLSIMAVGSEVGVSRDKGSIETNRKAGSRSSRNIVISRRKTDMSSSTSLTSQSSGAFIDHNDSQNQEGNNKPGVPCIISELVEDPPPLPNGVFLTSLTFEDPSIDPTSVSSSTCSRRVTRTPTSLKGHVCSTRDQILMTSRDSGNQSSALATNNTFGLQRVYLEGLDYMRSHVLNVERSVEAVNRQFHKVTSTDVDENWLRYLEMCNQQLLQANVILMKSDIALEVVDSEASLIKLINDLRSVNQPDMAVVDFLTNFWDELKIATHELQVQLDKFSRTVLHRISSNYMSAHISELQVPVCQKYTFDITDFQTSLDFQLTQATLLLKNYRPNSGTDLATNSDFSKRLMLSCDLKAFPILKFVNEICEMITAMCKTANHWLARDEQFMHDVHEFIRETRTSTRQRERVLHAEKIKQKKIEKDVKIAHNVLRHNRNKLARIEMELEELEHKLNTSKEEQKNRLVDIQHKEIMMDFLKVTLQQTKKNCRLQNKRTKLLKQVKEIEQYLKVMETDLEVVQDQILVKSHEKILLTNKISHSEKSYGFMKSDMDRFSENLEELEAEVSGLSSQLLQLEIVHTIRTSPEILDNLTDRPSSVKLSKSLKERIKQRVKKVVTMSR